MENQMDNGSSGKNQPNESRQDARLKQLKFEVAQEMGIKPKAKNKKN
ncbi:MAG: small, acid-soluble spore protein, alpha/beta type [Syntrophomonadaceae bacterium]|nr:small, acid-soluble spore protein, alpha/beta type [Syntrophomonadaceae bacterium]